MLEHNTLALFIDLGKEQIGNFICSRKGLCPFIVSQSQGLIDNTINVIRTDSELSFLSFSLSFL